MNNILLMNPWLEGILGILIAGGTILSVILFIIIGSFINDCIKLKGLPWYFTHRIMYNPDGSKYFYIKQNLIITYDKNNEHFALIHNGKKIVSEPEHYHKTVMSAMDAIQESYNKYLEDQKSKHYNPLK